jgi:hypothetical protein
MANKTVTKVKKPIMKRVNVYLPADIVDNFTPSKQGQTLSELIRYGIELTRQEELKIQTDIAKKFIAKAGSAGKVGDPMAWSKINDIYEI